MALKQVFKVVRILTKKDMNLPELVCYTDVKAVFLPGEDNQFDDYLKAVEYIEKQSEGTYQIEKLFIQESDT